MIEGGCVDKGAHESNAVTAAAEYLAFDETFAYVVNWARGRDDTIVVGVPDHDTGGLDVLDIEGAVRSVQSLVNPTDVIWNGDGNHTSQNVGIWLYAPDGARNTFLNAAGIPTDTAPDKVRSGKFYSGTVFNEDYAIENCDIIRGVEAVAGLSLSDATDELFARLDVPYSYRDGKYILNDSGIVLPLNCSYYVMPNGDKVNFEYGVTVRPENPPKLCVPRHILNKLRRTILPFNDVTKEDWFYGAVSKVYFDELMDGTAHDTFAPEKRMTRAELVTVIARLSGDDVSGMGSKLTYIDTPQNKWYSDYIGWASSEGIVNGYGDDSFRPDSPVSRQELAVIIDRYANATDAEFEAVPIIDDFRDRASFSSWSADAIENMRVAGIVGGDPSGNYNPGSTGTRAELATILSRYSSNLK